MGKMTPKTLAIAAANWVIGGQAHDLYKAVGVHIPAWEADRARIEALEADVAGFHAELVDAINDGRHTKAERAGLRMAAALFHRHAALAEEKRPPD